MNSPDNDNQDAAYALVTRRLSLTDPKYRNGFVAEMDRLADTVAQKISGNGIANTKAFRSELARLFKETEYEAYESKDGNKVLFRLLHPDHRYQPCTHFTPHAGNVILYPNRDGTPCIPHRLTIIPFDITIQKIVEMGSSSVGKTLLNALPPPKSDASPHDKDAKINALLAGEKENETTRADKAHEIAAEAERILRNRERRQQRSVKQKQNLKEKQAAQEVSERLPAKTESVPKSELVKLGEAVNGAMQTSLFAAKVVTRTTANIERLHKKIEENPQRARDPRITERLSTNIKKQPKALARAAEAATRLAEAQEALTAYKIKHHLRDEPANVEQEYGLANPHPPRFTPKQGLRAHARPH